MVAVKWRREYKNSLRLGKKAEALKGWTAAHLEVGKKLDLVEFLGLVFGESVKRNLGKVSLRDLPEWKAVEAFCLDSALACESPENGGSQARVWWDIMASRSGKSWYLVAKPAEERPMKFVAPQPTKSSEAVSSEDEAVSSDPDPHEEACRLLARIKSLGKSAEAVKVLEGLLESLQKSA